MFRTFRELLAVNLMREMGNEKWEVGCGEISKPDILEWEVGPLKVGSETQTRIPLFKISYSVSVEVTQFICVKGAKGYAGFAPLTAWPEEYKSPSVSTIQQQFSQLASAEQSAIYKHHVQPSDQPPRKNCLFQVQRSAIRWALERYYSGARLYGPRI